MGLDPRHDQLETDVAAYLAQAGYLTGDATYHNVMPHSIKARLTTLYDPTSLYVRYRADRVAVHTTDPVVFQWEAKTHKTRNMHDLTIALAPLVFHLANAERGVRCLYVYRDAERGYEAGFWAQRGMLPTVREIVWPDNHRREFTPYVNEMQMELGVPVRNIGRTAGSGEPFVVVDEQVVRYLPDWRLLIDEQNNDRPCVGAHRRSGEDSQSLTRIIAPPR